MVLFLAPAAWRRHGRLEVENQRPDEDVSETGADDEVVVVWREAEGGGGVEVARREAVDGKEESSEESDDEKESEPERRGVGDVGVLVDGEEGG